jgi:hypothetical protein
MNNEKCPKCSKELKLRDRHKYGWIIIIFVIISFPIELIFFKIISLYFNLICIAIGIYFIQRKDRYFYYCKKCIRRFSSNELKEIKYQD